MLFDDNRAQVRYELNDDLTNEAQKHESVLFITASSPSWALSGRPCPFYDRKAHLAKRRLMRMMLACTAPKSKQMRCKNETELSTCGETPPWDILKVLLGALLSQHVIKKSDISARAREL